MDDVVTFRVAGVPVPKGSMKMLRNFTTGRPVVMHDNTKSKPWANLVSLMAQRAVRGAPPWQGAVHLDLLFYLPRPKSLPKRITYHTKKPDLDKLIRNIKDALKGIVYRDDAQVVRTEATKSYTPDGEPDGVIIHLRSLP
ncbi:MAG TPA: RusA family crossover junction endodeoxyribonuclease [Candidatus Krumholzibacteria bacterium]|nr:RusA family crossover junction endodeoxyribonuclease [Candidatus Krumholzibacteria bacterium]